MPGGLPGLQNRAASGDRVRGVRFPHTSAGGELRLTEHASGAGCGCKLSAGELSEVISGMSAELPTLPGVLVGPGPSDDAGVFDLGDGRTLVQSIDVFTPVVDDPFDWGRIAAANALSDLHAMGAEPLTALQLLCWPRDLGAPAASAVLDGAAAVLSEERCAVLGGHSIDDPVPKFGLSVTGLGRDELLTNAGARPGDRLVLTKALGTGVITTANSAGDVGRDRLDAAVDSMVRSNRAASLAAMRLGAHACTDVTGFGLLGHLLEMCRASGVCATVEVDALPVLPGVGDLLERNHLSGGARRNRSDAERAGVDCARVDPRAAWLACDPQTSGGLLVAVPPRAASVLVDELVAQGHPAALIGSVSAGAPGAATVALTGESPEWT